MDVYILPSLQSSEFNPRGSCTLAPRALTASRCNWGTRVTSIKEMGLGVGARGGGRKFREWQIETARSQTSRAGRGRRGRKRRDPELPGPPWISCRTRRPRGSESSNIHTRPAASSDGKLRGGGRAGERKGQPRGGEQGRRCGSAPGWGSLTAGRDGTQRPWHLGGGCGMATRTEPSPGDMEGREGESAAKR